MWVPKARRLRPPQIGHPQGVPLREDAGLETPYFFGVKNFFPFSFSGKQDISSLALGSSWA